MIVIVSSICPLQRERQLVHELVDDGELLDVSVNSRLHKCEARNPKGLYKNERAGQLKNFTGIDSDYEPPGNPEISIDGVTDTLEALTDRNIEIVLASPEN